MSAEIDALAELDQWERILTAGTDLARCKNILYILERWRDDPDFNKASRDRATQLANRFCPTRYPSP